VLQPFRLATTPENTAAASAAIAIVVKHHRQAISATARPESGPSPPPRGRRPRGPAARQPPLPVAMTAE
jgi:hypothetical protein